MCRLKSLIAVLVLICAFAQPTRAGDNPSPAQTITGDLIGAGLSIGATLTGSVPLAFLSGFAAKYISTYGVAGVKKLIDYFKGHNPADLGEINIYYIYLVNAKRNLYGTLIDVRKAVEDDHSLSFLSRELDKVDSLITARCQAPEGCNPGLADQASVNFQFINIALDARSTVDVSRYLDAQHVKATYQYLMLLYMEILIVEQKLIASQYNVLAARVEQTLELLRKNPYLSLEEKELQAQMLFSIALRWIRMAESRRLIVAKAIEKPLLALETDNQALLDEIAEYHRRHGGGGHGKMHKLQKNGDQYQQDLDRIKRELQAAGTSIDANAQNPFQTGTALSGYFLSEKTLILERDAFFEMKANKLTTSEEVADFQHRIKVLRSHGNNILLQLLQAFERKDQEGFLNIEKPKQDEDLEKLIAECNKDAACVADRLSRPETSMTNIFIDNLALATQLFKQVPYMHELEVGAIYQLTQLIQLEVFFAQNTVHTVEFDIFYKAQKTLAKQIERNRELSEAERRLHTAMVKNTVNQWKKRILQRRYDHGEEFKAQALQLNAANKATYAEILEIRRENGAVLNGIPEQRDCFNWAEMGSRQWCNLKNALHKDLDLLGRGKLGFIGGKDVKLPDDFWKEL